MTDYQDLPAMTGLQTLADYLETTRIDLSDGTPIDTALLMARLQEAAEAIRMADRLIAARYRDQRWTGSEHGLKP